MIARPVLAIVSHGSLLRDVPSKAGGDDVEVLQTGVDQRLVGVEELAATRRVKDFALYQCDIRSHTGDANSVNRCAHGTDCPCSMAVEVLNRWLCRHE